MIDYRMTDCTRPAQPYAWIVDVDAHQPLRRWRRALRPRDVCLAIGGSSRWMLSLLLAADPEAPPDMDELQRLVASGAGKPAIDRRFTLDQVVDALTHVHEGRARGKVLVVS